jgi:Kef-type K+ transport system membrane component KefB
MESIPQLDKTGLRKFGLTFGLVIIAIFGVLLPLLTGLGYRLWPWIASGGFVLLALTAPASLGPFYRLWMRLGLVLNAVMSRLVLGIVFFIAVLPTGLVLKLRGIDPMRRKPDAQAHSYRVISERPSAIDMENPF